MKKILKIKWENIFLIIFIPLDIFAMISHHQTQISLILAEMFIYLGMTLVIWYGIKGMRKEALYENK
nr:MAG TPA: hypothetical protein [Caudoviricetes sp.]DAS16956.1 MAG TPA: hypothetical protein [Caudoviricetes sp.]